MLNPDFRDMLSAFAEEAVEFLVVGAYAMAAHGVPRATGDLDFWVKRSSENAERLVRALTRFGAPPDHLKAETFLTPETVIQIGVEPNRIDILTSIDGVQFEAAWERRITAEVDGLDLPVLGFDDLVDNKESVGRLRDLADVEELRRHRSG